MGIDAIVAVIVIVLLLASFGFAKLWWWVAFWASLTILLGGFELAAKLKTGMTLSQQFWAWSYDSRTYAWVLGGLVAVAGIGLGVHLVWKILKELI